MFTLTWDDAELDHLAEIYVTLTPDDRQRLANAIESLNTRLQNEPVGEGESRAFGHRLTFLPFVAIGFVVDVKLGRVRVNMVKRYGK